MGSSKQVSPGTLGSGHGMCSFRDFTQNGLWSGQSERYRRSLSVFPHRNAEYYAHNLCSPSPRRRERVFRSLEREFFTERDFFTPDRDFFTPERDFFENNQLDDNEAWMMLKKKVFPLESQPVRVRTARSVEREMPHFPPARTVLGHPRPVPHIQYNSLSNKPPIASYRSKIRPQNSAYKHDRNLYLASTPRKKSFFPIFQHKT